MKHLILLTITLMLLSVSAETKAQSNRSRQITVEERAKSITEWMIQELDLTLEQIAPVDSINLLFTKAQQIVFQSAADGNREKIREMMAALENEKEVALAQVFTEEQLAVYRTKIDKMLDNRRKQP